MCFSFKWFQNNDILEQKNGFHMLKKKIDNPILNKMPTYFGMTNYYNPLIEQKKFKI
jgi:hypothetical protein